LRESKDYCRRREEPWWACEEDWVDRAKYEVWRVLTLELGTEVVIWEESGRRVLDVFMGGNIRVLEDRGVEFTWRVHSQARGWTSSKRSTRCSKCGVLDWIG